MMRSKLWVVLMMAFCLTLTAYAQEETDAEAAEFDTGAVTEKTEVVTEAVQEKAVTETVVTEVTEVTKVVTKDVVVSVPSLTAENSVKMIEVLKGIEGVVEVKADLEAKTLTITCAETVDFEAAVMPKLKELDLEVKVIEPPKAE